MPGPPPDIDHPTVDLTHPEVRVAGPATERVVPALVLAWSREEPARLGEVVFVDGARVIGRGGQRPDDPAPRALLVRQRPGEEVDGGPLVSPRLSRQQLLVEPAGEGLAVRALGKRPLLVDGRAVTEATVLPGGTISVADELVFAVVLRPRALPPLQSYPRATLPAFGTPDGGGMVGESAAAWRLRERLAFAARAGAHVLLLGPSGAGKELAAQSLHALSPRAKRPLVARNAATFPEGLIDAELFGNVKNYPNPGMAERPGLIGEADGSTLFLDEIGELPSHLQAHLLRVLDGGGEYQRLGEARPRRADLRLVAATNRELGELKHDLAARLTLRIELPSLADRRDDLPLLLAHLVRKAAQRLGVAAPVPAAALVEALLRHRFTLEVRELEQLVWQALSDSPPGTLELTPSVRARLVFDEAPAAPRAEPDAAALQAALAAHGGSVSRAARALGLSSRYALYRLLKKHSIETEDE